MLNPHKSFRSDQFRGSEAFLHSETFGTDKTYRLFWPNMGGVLLLEDELGARWQQVLVIAGLSWSRSD